MFTKLNTITNKLNIVINENITPNFGEILNILQEINNDLSSILKNYGTQNLSDLIIICLGPDFVKKNCTNDYLKDKFLLLNKYVHPINYKVISWKKMIIK